MEIQNTTASLPEPYAAELGKSGEARGRNRAESAESDAARGDTVSVSQDALLLTEARRTAQNTPDVRADKVESLRIQVADGAYRPDSRLIAASLIREEPGLFQI
ncbi:flagellar biosynthesis anti-sigma factor FlgM [Desulfovibrio sp. SGI.169]|uniref:flagellar biosynthesis anti-sigma factor FlgM n=1 Tax=Desulfovibrio sp. SGI.169 TaxID=3420561 RepID=UPI003CFC8820